MDLLTGDLAFFGSLAICQFTPSMVLSTAFVTSGDVGTSPSQLDQSSASRIAGIRSVIALINLLARTVTITQASKGADNPSRSNRRQRNAKPRGTPSPGSMVHCSVLEPISNPSLNVC